MRIASNSTADLLSAINTLRQQQDKLIEQLSTGKRVNDPSDDPSASSLMVQNTAGTIEDDAYLSNVSTLTSQLQTIDSSLSSVITNLQQAITLGTEGATGTTNSTDQQTLAAEVEQIKQSVLAAANLTYQGEYVFSGTATSAAPYSADASASSGVKYNGNDQVNEVEIATGRTIAVNVPGDQIFSASGADVFQALTDLATALTNGDTTGIQTATAEVQTAYNQVNQQRTFYGNAVNTLSSDETFLNNQVTQYASQENTLVGADTATTVTSLVTTQTAYQATLSAVSKVVQTSLLDYLK
jgi:flagellar hook-associated protein 3 FlgL